MRWSRSYGADFIIYQGEAVPPLAGRAGFYLGGWPSFDPEPGSTKVTGRLGIFRVKWYRHADATGAITQRGLVQMDYYWKADVWVDAARQSEVDALVAILAQLPTFTHKPAPLPGVPQTALEYYAVPITAVVVLVIEVALTLAGAWTIGRRWPAAGMGEASRLFFRGVGLVGMTLAIAASAFGSAWWLHVKAGRFYMARGCALGSVAFVLLAAIWLVVLLVRAIAVRRRSHPTAA